MKLLTPEQRERQARLLALRPRREAHRKVKRIAKRLRREAVVADRRRFARRHKLVFDKNLEREQIILPSRLSLKENHAQTVAILARMRELALEQNKPLMLHVEHVEPSATLVLVAEIFRIRHLRGLNYVHGTYPMRRMIYELLSEMGFFQLLSISEAFGKPRAKPDLNRPIFLRFYSGNRLEAAGINAFVSIVEEHLFPLNELARGKLVGAIKEAISNTLDHAHPDEARIEGETMPQRWWLSSWVNLADREIMIMLFDQGVGIPATLEPRRYELVRAALRGFARFRGLTDRPGDGEMIAAATETWRTGTRQGGRGRGFQNMKRFVDECDDGELRVLSRRGSYAYIPGTETHADESSPLNGTLIEWRFRHTGSVDMRDE